MDMRSPNSTPATIPANAPSTIQPGSEIARRPRFSFAVALGAVCASGPSVSLADLIEWAELTFSDIRRCLKLPITLEQTILQRASIQLQRDDLLAWGSAKTPIIAPQRGGASRVRFTPESGHRAPRLACPLCAKSGQLHRSITNLFDHLVGAGEQRSSTGNFWMRRRNFIALLGSAVAWPLLEALLPGPVRGAIFPIKSNPFFAVWARSRDLPRARSRALPAPPGRNS